MNAVKPKKVLVNTKKSKPPPVEEDFVLSQQKVQLCYEEREKKYEEARQRIMNSQIAEKQENVKQIKKVQQFDQKNYQYDPEYSRKQTFRTEPILMYVNPVQPVYDPYQSKTAPQSLKSLDDEFPPLK